MAVFKAEVFIKTETREQAEKVLKERLGHDEEYGFEYIVWFWNDVKEVEDDHIELEVNA